MAFHAISFEILFMGYCYNTSASSLKYEEAACSVKIRVNVPTVGNTRTDASEFRLARRTKLSLTKRDSKRDSYTCYQRSQVNINPVTRKTEKTSVYSRIPALLLFSRSIYSFSWKHAGIIIL